VESLDPNAHTTCETEAFALTLSHRREQNRDMSSAIEQDLDRIAERVAELVRLTQSLREENQTLRISADQREGENKVLRERLETARERVESLISRLPAES
jgi:uncharacterized protein (TIGR02449 family)